MPLRTFPKSTSLRGRHRPAIDGYGPVVGSATPAWGPRNEAVVRGRDLDVALGSRIRRRQAGARGEACRRRRGPVHDIAVRVCGRPISEEA